MRPTRHYGGEKALVGVTAGHRWGITSVDVRTAVARQVEINLDTVSPIWKDHELQPWKSDGFKASTDPSFEEKLINLMRLYRSAPQHAVVFSFDEKTQVQALKRTQEVLPVKKWRGVCP